MIGLLQTKTISTKPTTSWSVPEIRRNDYSSDLKSSVKKTCQSALTEQRPAGASTKCSKDNCNMVWNEFLSTTSHKPVSLFENLTTLLYCKSDLNWFLPNKFGHQEDQLLVWCHSSRLPWRTGKNRFLQGSNPWKNRSLNIPQPWNSCKWVFHNHSSTYHRLTKKHQEQNWLVV